MQETNRILLQKSAQDFTQRLMDSHLYDSEELVIENTDVLIQDIKFFFQRK